VLISWISDVIVVVSIGRHSFIYILGERKVLWQSRRRRHSDPHAYGRGTCVHAGQATNP
jgi:hypothetical protein